jgi:ABC-2 type transport system ATP-binding protein
VLFLDEPTSDLDPVMQREVIALIQEVNKQGVTVVMASHHLESLEKICTKIAIVHDQKVHSYGEFEDIQKPFLKDHININVKAGKDTEKIIAMVKRMPVTKIIDKGDQLVIYPQDTDRTLAQLMAMIKKENLYLYDIDLRKPTLDEVFVQITRKS